MPSLITTSAVTTTAASATNEENEGGYGSKHKLMHDGYSFNRKNDSKKAVQFNCINNCGKHSVCSAQIKILKMNGSIVEKGKHGNICAQKIGNENAPKDVTNVDFTHEMMERVDELAIETLGIQPTTIWKKVSVEITAKSKTWKGMTDDQVINRVNNIRRDA